jgi:aminoglycoside phosphotransferase (APT) family kinase protein
MKQIVHMYSDTHLVSTGNWNFWKMENKLKLANIVQDSGYEFSKLVC